MQERVAKTRIVHENLDTAFVNLAALLRYLQGREFSGRVHVELDEYEADVFLNANEKPRAREKDHATGRQAEGEDALQRLLVRAREPGGLVSVYENTVGETGEEDSSSVTDSGETESVTEVVGVTDEESDRLDLVRLSGELIATIERAGLSAGADFVNIFRAVRIEMADDYSFLDPSAGQLEYANGTVRLRASPSAGAYVAGVSEAMRRVVDRIATGPRRATVRERVALELAVLA
ncbi:MAG: hypothetical protein DMF68_20790, partial [Acidobacteria bacterium]